MPTENFIPQNRFTFHRLTDDSSPKIFEALSVLDKLCVGADGWSAESIRSEAAKETGIVFCCYAGNAVAGLICGYFAGGESEINSIAVHPDNRRNGIASRLISKFIDALPYNTESIFLEVRTSNDNALALYEKCGFERLSVRKNFYINPREDAVVMKKSLHK